MSGDPMWSRVIRALIDKGRRAGDFVFRFSRQSDSDAEAPARDTPTGPTKNIPDPGRPGVICLCQFWNHSSDFQSCQSQKDNTAEDCFIHIVDKMTDTQTPVADAKPAIEGDNKNLSLVMKVFSDLKPVLRRESLPHPQSSRSEEDAFKKIFLKGKIPGEKYSPCSQLGGSSLLWMSPFR
ncbi:hypothetical protein GWK47_042205 [Chionoecetes opilio]|uniref:Uncharacterized protein n=1 Tax=Chionoecetes opilio TaxID=41210 RepID=A0A8J4Y928_CHIOP|nr:hypothetical protein GWK47_042205 [Chionoecetes opilio]